MDYLKFRLNKAVMKQLFTLFLMCAGWYQGFGQSMKEDFYKALQKGDTTDQIHILTAWERKDSQDAELFTAYFNYYYKKSQQEAVILSQQEFEGDELEVADSSGNIVGYIGSQTLFNDSTMQKGFEKIDQGIELYPNRLDMRFGKIHVLGEMGNWKAFTDEIIKTIQYSAVNKNKWTWTDNEKQNDAEQFLLECIQDYQYEIYNANNDDLLVYMRTIANEVLKYYPNHMESYSNIGITYLIENELDKAEEAFLKAEELAPEDPVILSNLAQCYERMYNRDKAVIYYNKLLKYGDDSDKNYATERIKALQD